MGRYDDDGRPDLFISNLGQANRLYRNKGDGTFADVAELLGVTEPDYSFSCWFWDYDNDGRLDIFVTGSHATLGEIILSQLGRPTGGERPRLYHNDGDRFTDVTREIGLDRVWLPMGSNFGDIDNDGFLDFYLGTGSPPYSYVVPNVLMHNVGGRRFEDVTIASGTGHLQKGHGISFADWDRDGDQDLFLSPARGARQGAQRPLPKPWPRQSLAELRGRHAVQPCRDRRPATCGCFWTRRPAIRTLRDRRRIELWQQPAGAYHWPRPRRHHRRGRNHLAGRRQRQTVRNLPLDRAVEITEGQNGFRVLDWARVLR